MCQAGGPEAGEERLHLLQGDALCHIHTLVTSSFFSAYIKLPLSLKPQTAVYLATHLGFRQDEHDVDAHEDAAEGEEEEGAPEVEGGGQDHHGHELGDEEVGDPLGQRGHGHALAPEALREDLVVSM